MYLKACEMENVVLLMMANVVVGGDGVGGGGGGGDILFGNVNLKIHYEKLLRMELLIY